MKAGHMLLTQIARLFGGYLRPARMIVRAKNTLPTLDLRL
jgi:hypothetical protein